MDQEMVDSLRRFSRIVTARVGALDDRYLARNRPLGQARVLWEIGPEGIEVGTLRGRLELDSAQLSRTLRALEADALVFVVPHDHDARVRVARLTAAGEEEWAALERASDRAAREMLEPLSASQRERLTRAVTEVERLLLASMVRMREVLPSTPAARSCLRAYTSELADRFGGHFDPGGGDDALAPPDGVLLVAYLQEEPIGCGGLRLHPGAAPEVKRLWTAPGTRGMGVGRRLLAELETRAAGFGATRVRLDSNRALTEAIALYRAAGYRQVPRYNDNPHAHLWFEKRLTR